jgi:hypothetical protein
MLLKVVPDKTALEKFKISNNFKQPKTTKNPWENPYQPMDFKTLKKKSTNQKSRDFCQMFVISKKKTIP